MTTRYTIHDLPCPEDIARQLADQLIVRDEQYGRLVRRMRTEQHVELRSPR